VATTRASPGAAVSEVVVEAGGEKAKAREEIAPPSQEDRRRRDENVIPLMIGIVIVDDVDVECFFL
jgi:hypothetical protein